MDNNMPELIKIIEGENGKSRFSQRIASVLGKQEKIHSLDKRSY